MESVGVLDGDEHSRVSDEISCIGYFTVTFTNCFLFPRFA